MSDKVIKEAPLLNVESPSELRERAKQEIKVPDTWKVSNETKGLIAQSLSMYNTKHGLYAAIPLIPKDTECLYGDLCPMNEAGIDHSGQRCPLEISLIMKRYDEYVRAFDVDEDNVTDMGLIKDLVDYDVQLFRAENKIARDGDFVEDIVVGVTDNGRELTAPQISKAAEYKEKIMTKKHKVLQLMHSTRSDKAGDKLTLTLDPSSYASQLMSQIADEMQPGQIFDADFEEIEES